MHKKKDLLRARRLQKVLVIEPYALSQMAGRLRWRRVDGLTGSLGWATYSPFDNFILARGLSLSTLPQYAISQCPR